MMNWLIDIGALLIIALLAFIGYKQGLVKALIGLIGFVLALILSLSLSGPIAGLLYDNYISDTMKSSLTDYINSMTGKTTSGMINGQTIYMSSPVLATAGFSYEDILRQFQEEGGTNPQNLTEAQKAQIATQIQNGATVEKIVQEYNKTTGADVSIEKVTNALGVEADTAMKEVVESSGDTSSDTGGFDIGKIIKGFLGNALDAEKITDDVVDGTIRPMIMNILSSIVFVVLFIILSLIFALISGAVGKLATKIPVFGTVNALLGGVFGLVKGAGLAVIVLMIVAIVAKGSSNAKFREAADNSIGCSIVETWLPDSML